MQNTASSNLARKDLFHPEDPEISATMSTYQQYHQQQHHQNHQLAAALNAQNIPLHTPSSKTLEPFPTLTHQILSTGALSTYINDLPPHVAHLLPEIAANEVSDTVFRLLQNRHRRRQAEWCGKSHFERREEMRRRGDVLLAPSSALVARRAAVWRRRAVVVERGLRRDWREWVRPARRREGGVEGLRLYAEELGVYHRNLFERERVRQERGRIGGRVLGDALHSDQMEPADDREQDDGGAQPIELKSQSGPLETELVLYNNNQAYTGPEDYHDEYRAYHLEYPRTQMTMYDTLDARDPEGEENKLVVYHEPRAQEILPTEYQQDHHPVDVEPEQSYHSHNEPAQYDRIPHGLPLYPLPMLHHNYHLHHHHHHPQSESATQAERQQEPAAMETKPQRQQAGTPQGLCEGSSAAMRKRKREDSFASSGRSNRRG
ncbi:hypothetical protein FKW77_005449 [Venturia effusa]|uniref:Uncharacterized protein n=1 Tax=Venturia effusa TaxID=50376 RepID=A0A517LAY3_9PEZI|nr:hypothetical protein FKW77_005449 [Venturia effusa]